ncbi:(2Fe-2S)-binding protein [Spirochaeta cellobiosiphila]|uniref:(2Fe-2S)-binding protein n=1 Tax=Spirochaeta cellobiosiphila TaxID=504483 RepID=UPI00041E6EFB|nr:(2Fe-2S)-binding protein [Spirochaeta cellobiosiphila]
MRIKSHPILGDVPSRKEVTFYYDDQELRGYQGEPISVALLAAGVKTFRYTGKGHKPRGVFCSIGRCTDCVMTVDGVPNTRTCVTPLVEGMRVQTQFGILPKNKAKGAPS